jgi:hypothetical protein
MKKIVLFSAFFFSVMIGFSQSATNGYHGNPRGGGQGHGSHSMPTPQPPVMSGHHVETHGHGGLNGGGPRGGPRGGGYVSPPSNGYGYNSGAACGSNGAVYSGGGNGMVYSGGVNTVAVVPMCGMCHGHHAALNICEMEFSSIVRAVRARCFESDKMLVARQALYSKMLSSDQVRRLMLEFTFESSRLEFAKYAYSRTFDPMNYYIVNDSFTFSSSIRDLDRFIRRC